MEQERKVVDAVDFADGSYNAKPRSEHRSPTTLTDTAATRGNNCNSGSEIILLLKGELNLSLSDSK